jgi:transcriptional regulator with XRE-family HTH domain
MDKKEIGSRLRHARESMGFTQAQVAKFLGIQREVVSYLETGTRPITTLILQKLADLYGYKFSHFVDEVVKETGPEVSMAFRIADLGEHDLQVIAQVKRIALNYTSMSKLLDGDKNAGCPS